MKYFHMKFTFYLFLCLFSLSSLIGQNLEWQQTYGGPGKDLFNDAHKLSDGSLVFAGSISTDENDLYDFWLLKMDQDGNVLWQNSYGGSDFEICYDFLPCFDGGFVLIGSSNSSDGDFSGTNNGLSDFWIVKTDSEGMLQWEKNYGGSNSDNSFKVIELANGGYVVGGNSESSDGDRSNNFGSWDVWLIGLDAAGNLLWEQNYGGSSFERIDDVIATNDGGFMMAGYTESTDGDITDNDGGGDILVLKVDALGNLQWEKTYGGSYTEFAYDLLETNDGNYLFVGRTNSSNGDLGPNSNYGNGWAVKIDGIGNIIWEQRYGSYNIESLNSALQTPDGGFLLAGEIESYEGVIFGDEDPTGHMDFWIVKTDANGIVEWEESYNSNGTNEDEVRSVLLCDDGSIVLNGFTRFYNYETNKFERDARVMKIDLLDDLSDYCFDEMEALDLSRKGALSAIHTDIEKDGTETYTWYNENDEQLAKFVGNPYYSPSEIGSFYVIVRDGNGTCQYIGPRTINELNGCCELDE